MDMRLISFVHLLIQTGFKMLKIGFLLHVPDDMSPKADA